MRGIGVLALAVVAVHLVLATTYGFHRDEIYLLQHGVHAFDGSLDHAIATPLLSRVSQALFGATPFALRVGPALLAGALVLVAAALCGRLGGDRSAQWLAAAIVASSPVFIYVGGVFGTNSIDQLVAAALALLVAKPTPRRWLLAGLVLGIGVANKLTIVVVWASLLAALALVDRRWLRTPWPYAATLIGAAFAIPDLLLAPESPFALIGRHHAARVRDVAASDFWLGQLVDIHVVGLVAVTCALAAARRDAGARLVAASWAIGGIALALGHAKHYQWAAWYPAAIAAGAIPLAAWWHRRSPRLRYALAAAFVVSGVASWWLTLAPPAWLGVHRERVQFADWSGLVAQIARLREAAGLPRDTPVVTDSYGTAAAVELAGLPLESGANSYFAWTRPLPATTVLWLGYTDELRGRVCRTATPLGTVGFGDDDNRFDFPRILYRCELAASLGKDWELIRAFD